MSQSVCEVKADRPHGLGGLVGPDGKGGGDAGGDGAGHGQPVGHPDRALAPQHEGHRLPAAVLLK